MSPGRRMAPRLPVSFSAAVVVSFVVLIALPLWLYHGDFLDREIQLPRQVCPCKTDHCGLNATSPLQGPHLPEGRTVVNEDDCDPDLFPHGHWTRIARASSPNPTPSPNKWTTTGHRMLYGTIAVQHAIWQHQHPENCKQKKFIIYQMTGTGNGIGSILHRTTILLQAALDLDRILVLFPQPHGQWIHAPYCTDHGAYTIDSCYFEPISSCSIQEAVEGRRWEDLTEVPWLDAESYARNEARVLKYDCERSGALFLIRSTPVMFHELMQKGNVSIGAYYWWRAQGVAYIVRPNERTLREIECRRIELFRNGTIEDGVVSVHVRHGDKVKESRLAADEKYLEVAERVVRERKDLSKRTMFLSTEDAHTVAFFEKVKNWTVRWTEVKRQKGYEMSMADFARNVGWDEEFLNSLLSLELALECDAWVGMISSNWNRLVDELRSTIRCKYGSPYVDVFVGANITDYDWR